MSGHENLSIANEVEATRARHRRLDALRTRFEDWGHRTFNYGFHPESWDGANYDEHTDDMWLAFKAGANGAEGGA